MSTAQAMDLAIRPNASDPDRTASARQAPAVRARAGLGKYREIVIAVAFFLLFDLGVLVLNFYTSFRIAEDAVGINLAGRQRMLSQRTAKALYAIEAGTLKGVPVSAELEELRAAVTLFDTALKGFQSGGLVPGGDGKPVMLVPARGERAAGALAEAQRLWMPYQERLAPVLAGGATAEQVAAAADYARQHNVRLLGLMNELTTALEVLASDRASTLRQVQTGGIVLALLNFIFILFKFLRRLRASDAAIEAANEENREILQSVREGLFLLTPQLRIGSQISSSAPELFGQPVNPGDDLVALLAPMVSEKALADARAYLELLFQPHVKPQLMQGINPLAEVQVAVRNRLGAQVQRYLSFRFNRVADGGRVRHLLVTVQDVTERVQLLGQLNAERQRSQREFSMLLKAASADPGALRQFVDRAEAALLEVNDLLRGFSASASEDDLRRQATLAARRIHAVKGDAGALGLQAFAELAHRFEDELTRVHEPGSQRDAALLALPLPLEDMLGQLGALRALARSAVAGPGDRNSWSAGWIQSQVASAAAALGRRVQVHAQLQAQPPAEPQRAALLQEILVQLLRNAVAHGIEPPATRLALGKPAEGRIDVGLVRDDGLMLTVRDDGAGLNPQRIRERLLALGWYEPAQLDQLSERDLIGQIFRPGFSTAEGSGLYAGRGVGLDLVYANVNKLGAQLSVSSRRSGFTEFRIRVPD